MSNAEAAVTRVCAEVARLHGDLVRYGLFVRTGVNGSRRGPDTDFFVTKPSGVAYEDVAPRGRHPVRPRRRGRRRDAGSDRSPSSDTAAHHPFVIRGRV